MATLWTLGCDAADPHRIAAFWAGALGYVAEPGYDDPDGASIIDPEGVGPAISFLRVPEGKNPGYGMAQTYSYRSDKCIQPPVVVNIRDSRSLTDQRNLHY
jgi:hypothetical protein